MAVRVVLVDDQQMVRTGFRMILESEPGIEVVGEAADGDEALRVAEWARPDVVLMDVQMPGVDGITATRTILDSERAAGTRVLILTTFERDDYLFDALGAGASGFLLKNAPPEELIRAVMVVAAGDALLAPSVTRRIIADVAERRRTPRPDLGRLLDQLTEREREVLELMALGLANSEIADRLIVGEATVKTHVSRVLMKLELRDRIQAVVFAYESGVVKPGG